MPSPLTYDPLSRLTELVRAERLALVAVARREGLDAEDAIECVQDALCTFLGLDTGLTPVSDEHVVASVKTMVRNAARNTRRLHRVARPHLAIAPDAEPAADGALAEELLVHAEDVVRLRVCVASLCDVQRSVVMLRLLDERSGEDVAEALGLTRGHVDVLVHRAKGALRVCMRHAASNP
jgi:RNA polymerase sigma-70 factor (ECF subfamily)